MGTAPTGSISCASLRTFWSKKHVRVGETTALPPLGGRRDPRGPAVGPLRPRPSDGARVQRLTYTEALGGTVAGCGSGQLPPRVCLLPRSGILMNCPGEPPGSGRGDDGWVHGIAGPPTGDMRPTQDQ